MVSIKRYSSEDEEPVIPRHQKMHGKIYEALLDDRKIFIAEEITVDLASNIVAALLYLDKQSHNKISIYINSCGGDIDGLFSILDMIGIIESPVETICFGEASSSAAILLAAGTPGMRLVTENARIMIHQVWIDSLGGTVNEIAKETKSLNATKKKLTEILARYCGQTYKKVYDDCEDDKYMTAKEAVVYGIVDEIMSPTKEIPKLRKPKSK